MKYIVACCMNISHGSRSASVVYEDFGFIEALNDSPASSAYFERVGCLVDVDNPHNRILEVLGLQHEFALDGIMKPTLHCPTRLAPKE